MWKLKSTKKEHWDQYIFVGEECIVGRKDATLLISNDPSVSRKHAVLSVKHPEENIVNLSSKSSLFLRDEGSKYGTFKNGVQISKEEQLSDGDDVKFGQFESEFRIHYESLVVTTSCLDVTSKNKLKKIIHKLGGHIASEWQPSCTHLVMSSIKITIKALCCLVSLKPIVLPEYFEELEKKLKSSATVVLPKEFMPPIGESLIDKDAVSFDVNPERKNLFKNKTFFFMDNKQFKKLHLGIVTGGGNASVLSEDKFNPDLLLRENTCFIEPVKGLIITEESKNFLKNIVKTLQTKNLRMIPESDIGLAVAYASTEKFCNPTIDIGSIVLGTQRIPSQSLSQREVYVPDTQESIKRPKPSISNFLSISSSAPKPKKQKIEAADTLNLTSFRGDPEGIYEIPLSAEVKQELDDIFDITTKDDEGNVQNGDVEMESALPVEQVPEPKINVIEPKKTEKVPKNRLSSKSKVEESTFQVNGFTSNENSFKVNGCTSKRISPKSKVEKESTFEIISSKSKAEESTFLINDNNEENLDRNLIIVEFASLVVRKPVLATEQQKITSHVKNFKKFKKVLPLKAQALPRIIGAHELIPYDKNAASFEDNFVDEPEIIHTRRVQQAFDWDSQKD